MSAVTLSINGQDYTIDVPPDMPLLWALRDVLNLTGTKYSCGIGTCGRCNIGDQYVCKDGPVFSLAKLKQMPGEY